MFLIKLWFLYILCSGIPEHHAKSFCPNIFFCVSQHSFLLFLYLQMLLTMDCILMLSLPSDSVLRLMPWLCYWLLIRCYHASTSGLYPVVHSHMCLTSNSWLCQQHRPLCVLTSLVTISRDIGQELQKKPLLQLDLHQVCDISPQRNTSDLSIS